MESEDNPIYHTHHITYIRDDREILLTKSQSDKTINPL